MTIEKARTIITRNDSPDILFDRSINPYRGCEHGCSYCFARPSHAFQGLSSGLDFETKLFAKTNAPELLMKEISAKGYAPRTIALGTNTDPYQPIERRFRITRSILEVLERGSTADGSVQSGSSLPAAKAPPVERSRLASTAQCVVAALIGFAVPLVGLWMWSGYDTFGVALVNLRNHAEFYQHSPRTYRSWLMVNPAELGLAIGLPVVVAAFYGLFRSRSGRLGVQAHVESAQPPLHRVARTAAHDVHTEVLVGCQRLEHRHEFFVGRRAIGSGRKRNQRPVVIQNHEPAFCPGACDDTQEFVTRARPRSAPSFGRFPQGRQKPAGPCVDVVLEDARPESPHAPPALIVRQGERPPHRARHPSDIERVDMQRLTKLRPGAGELTQDQCAFLIAAARDELLRNQVHSVAQRSDDHDVRGAIQCRDLVLRQRLVNPVNRHSRRRAVLTVDSSN